MTTSCPRWSRRATTDEGTAADDELLSIAMLLLAAGFETTVNLIGNGTRLLLEHPDQRARLAAEPELWPNAVDEILRFESPVQRTGRVAAKDTEVCGIPVRRGSLIITHLGGANRDPAVFADPTRFDVGRDGADRHVSFSSGIHYCLGAALAKMEGEVGLRALFERFPEMSADGCPSCAAPACCAVIARCRCASTRRRSRPDGPRGTLGEWRPAQLTAPSAAGVSGSTPPRPPS